MPPAVAVVRPWYRDLRYTGPPATAIAVLGAAGSLLGLTTDLFIAPWRLMGADLGDLAHTAAAVACLAGASAISGGLAGGGRRVLVGGLALNLLALVAFPGPSLADPFVLAGIALWAGLLGLTWRSRMPFEP